MENLFCLVMSWFVIKLKIESLSCSVIFDLWFATFEMFLVEFPNCEQSTIKWFTYLDLFPSDIKHLEKLTQHEGWANLNNLNDKFSLKWIFLQSCFTTQTLSSHCELQNCLTLWISLCYKSSTNSELQSIVGLNCWSMAWKPIKSINPTNHWSKR